MRRSSCSPHGSQRITSLATDSESGRPLRWIGVRRSDCSGVWSVQAGTPLRNDGEAVCDVHGVSGCELVRATMKRTTTRTHELVDLVHVQRFERPGQPTQTVLSELQSNYGEPLWKQAIRRSSGWPEVIEETSFIWSTRKEGPPAQHVVARFEEEAINRLGTGDYLVVTLLNNDDDRVTYAITAKLRRVGAPGPTNGTAQ